MPPDKDLLSRLVEDFDRRKTSGELNAFSEEDYKQHFITPFWQALGWNMSDPHQVRMEQAVRMTVGDDRGSRRIDYLFYTHSRPVMVVEAKASGHVLGNPDYVFQTKKYGYSKSIDVSILTNFEYFAPFDTGLFPSYENSRYGLISGFDLTYKLYLDRFDELCHVFSKDAVVAGSLQTLLPEARRRTNKESIDRKFLEQLSEWRDRLAKTFYKYNPDLTADDLNEAVQRILDRIIFTRVLEDREIEQTHHLMDALNTWKSESRDRNTPTLYQHIIKKFEYLRRRYNGQIFGPISKPPHFSENLLLPDEDRTLREIVENLYGRKCAYAFGEIPIEILGRTYEKFLGSTILINEKNKPELGIKPELRKQHGVYYTPKWVVEYIVQKTVGVLLQGRTPTEVSKLRVVDPACGSGSFLIGAYEYICHYLENWFTANPEKISKKEPECWLPEGEDHYRLTARAKMRVALENIYGVDLDPQAVEITQMSFYIKMLEDVESPDLFGGVRLPDMSANIKCGNSLVGADYKTEKDKKGNPYWDGDLESLKHLRPFDWSVEFADVFTMGGFDAVIGNPPYVRQESLSAIKEYLTSHYHAFTASTDLYVGFMEKGLSLLKPEGRFGYIVSNKWMRARYGEGLRKLITENHAVEEMVDFGELPVFEDAATFPVILVISNRKSDKPPVYAPVKSLVFDDLAKLVSEIGYPLPVTALSSGGWTLVQSDMQAVLDKMKNVGIPLGELVNGKLFYGIKTGFNEAFVIDKKKRNELIALDPNCGEIIKPFVVGDDVRKYHINYCDRYLIVTRIGIPIKQYPAIFEHLKQYETQLEKRWDKGEHWWELRTCSYYAEFEKPKIVWPDIALENRFTLDVNKMYFNNTTYIMDSSSLSVLTILNSKLAWEWFKNTCFVLGDPSKRGRLRLINQFVVNLPIHLPDPAIPEEVKQGKRLEELAEMLLNLNNKLHGERRTDGSGEWAIAPTRNDAEQTLLKREIEAAEREVDTIVYELYGLTDAEVRLVEVKE